MNIEDEDSEEDLPEFITILDLAKFRGVKEGADGSISMGAIEDVGLPLMGGCSICGACIAAYNACPSYSGYLKCSRGCIGCDGFDTVEEANREMFPDEYKWQGVKKPNHEEG